MPVFDSNSVQQAVQNTVPLNVVPAKKSKNKIIIAVLAVLIILLAVIFAITYFGGNGGQKVHKLTKSDIEDVWYIDGSEYLRTVFSFTEDGQLLMAMESGDFFEDIEPWGTFCGSWELVEKNTIKISYENAESEISKSYFGDSGLANVELSEDGGSITFYVDAKDFTQFTLKKYPHL